MSEVKDRMADKTLRQEGFDWVLQLASGEATVADLEALRRWRASSPDHERAFAEAVALRAKVRSAVEAGRDAPPTLGVPARRARPQLNRRALFGGAVAASAAGYMLVRPPLDAWPSLSELTADYRTKIGERRQVAVGPGVSLDLNTRTSVADRSVAGRPRIELVSGEVAITAARKPGAAPLVAIAGAGRAIVAAGAVDIRRDGDVVCVACLSGRARILHPAGEAALSARQQVAWTADKVDAVAEVDPTAVGAWRSGRLVFRNRPLSDVVREINRYRPGRIVLTNAALGQRTVYGVFHTDHIDGAVEEIRSLVGARATRLPGGVVLLS